MSADQFLETFASIGARLDQALAASSISADEITVSITAGAPAHLDIHDRPTRDLVLTASRGESLARALGVSEPQVEDIPAEPQFQVVRGTDAVSGYRILVYCHGDDPSMPALGRARVSGDGGSPC